MDVGARARRARRAVGALMVLAWWGFMGPGLIQITSDHPMDEPNAWLAHVAAPVVIMAGMTVFVWVIGRRVQKEIDALAGVGRGAGERSAGTVGGE